LAGRATSGKGGGSGFEQAVSNTKRKTVRIRLNLFTLASFFLISHITTG
jgi:hypothetical protein